MSAPLYVAPIDSDIEGVSYLAGDVVNIVGWSDAAIVRSVERALIVASAAGPPGDPGDPGDPGAPAGVWKGNWNPYVAYVANDLVLYRGSTYRANKSIAAATSVLPTYRGVTHNSNFTSFTVAIPTGVVVGDTLLLIMESSDAPVAPVDWTFVDKEESAANNKLHVYKKTATAADTPGSTITVSGMGGGAAQIRAYSAIEINQIATSATQTFPALTSDGPNHTVVHAQSIYFSSGQYAYATSFGGDANGDSYALQAGYQHGVGSAHKTYASAGVMAAEAGWAYNAANGFGSMSIDISRGAGASDVLPTADFDLVAAAGSTGIYTPTGSADTAGLVGDISYDASYLYLKTSAGWARTALSTF